MECPSAARSFLTIGWLKSAGEIQRFPLFETPRVGSLQESLVRELLCLSLTVFISSIRSDLGFHWVDPQFCPDLAILWTNRGTYNTEVGALIESALVFLY